MGINKEWSRIVGRPTGGDEIEATEGEEGRAKVDWGQVRGKRKKLVSECCR